MNKKFSTLLSAGLLMGGALCVPAFATDVTPAQFKAAMGAKNVFSIADLEKELGKDVAFDGKIELTGAVDLSSEKYVVFKKDANGVILTSKDTENPVTLTGRLVVAAEGMIISDLKLANTPANIEANGYWTKNSITVFANTATITNNEIAANKVDKCIPNGIVFFPQGKNVAYTVTGNAFRGFEGSADPWYSNAIIVSQGFTPADSKTADPLNGEELLGVNAGKAPAIVESGLTNDLFTNNEFSGSDADIYVSKSVEGVEQIGVLQVSADNKGALSANSKKAIQEAVQYAQPDGKSAVTVIGATAETVAAAIQAGTATNYKNKNVIINAENKAIVVGTVDKVPAGAMVIVADGTNTNVYAAELVATKVSSGSYVLMATDGKALQGVEDKANNTDKAKAAAKAYDATDDLFVWNVNVDGPTGKARFINKKTGKYLVDDSGTLVEVATTNGKLDPSNFVLSASNAVGGVTAASKFALGVYTAPVNALKASDLRSIYGTSFYAAVEYAAATKDEEKVLANNPFNENLKPVVWNDLSYSYDLVPAYPGQTSFMLQKENGKLIVMQTTDKYASATVGKYAYQIVEVDAKTLATAIKTGKDDIYASMFSIYAPFNFEVGKNEVVSYMTVSKVDASSNVLSTYKLGSIELKSVNTLAACDINDDFLDEVTISLSKFGRLKAQDLMTGKFYTITNKNTKKDYSNNFGKVLGLDNYGNAEFKKASEVLVGYPETQWAATVDNYKLDGKDAVRIKFTNRENPEGDSYYIYPDNCYKTDEAGVYARYVNYSAPFSYDTIEIKAVAAHAPSDGFVRFDYTKLKDQLFYMGSYSAVRDTAYVTENHKENHQVGLEKDKANATAWRMVPLMFQKEDAWGEPIKNEVAPDTICVVSTVGIMKNGAISTQKDTLKMLAYAFKNIENDEFMAYDNRERYTTGSETNKVGYDAQRASYFTLKIMGGDSTKYNLVEVDHYVWVDDYGYANEIKEGGDYDFYINNNNKPYSVKNLTTKAYAGETSAKGILNQYKMYQQNESDLFTLTQKESAQYLSFDQGDVIKIFRAEYAESESNVLYEKGEFLGVGNAIENNKINPAIYVDPIIGSKDHPEYLLAVNAIHKDTTYTCNEPSHAHLTHKADTVWGRFLVNLADSAIVTEGKEDIHVNKYTYLDGNYPYAKLGFVQGVCSNDTLFHVDTVAVGVASEYKITEAPQLFKFAFRVVEPAANINESTFVLETGYKYPSDLDNDVKVGYLRFINGQIVVTDDIKEAEVFKLKDDNRKPVANEDINASAISVVATNGAVIIKGAEGKKVAISNILGQTIANTVLTSDEATIAAPAGVVVVSVEGESAVKAIVK